MQRLQSYSGNRKIIDDIDIINICTGLVPDDQLLVKGKEVFGIHTFGIGDAIRIGEGTSAVLRGNKLLMRLPKALANALIMMIIWKYPNNTSTRNNIRCGF